MHPSGGFRFYGGGSDSILLTMLYLAACFLFAIGQIAAAWGYGRWALRCLGVPPGSERSQLEPSLHFVLALATGLAAMTFLTAMLGFGHGFGRPAFAVLLGAGWVLLAWTRPWARAGGSRVERPASVRTSLGPTVLACLPAAGVLLLEGLRPDCSGDAYLYHLSIPLYYLYEGGFAPQDYAFYYHYPLGMEMLYL
ncbi:MAG: hypothetical protein M1457_07780, partial [bacterium]|nr:hypothetical protein [bacterium]